MRETVKLIHEGGYAAEVTVTVVDEDGGWAPYISIEDASRLDTVRRALREGDVATAARDARVFELTPVSA